MFSSSTRLFSSGRGPRYLLDRSLDGFQTGIACERNSNSSMSIPHPCHMIDWIMLHSFKLHLQCRRLKIKADKTLLRKSGKFSTTLHGFISKKPVLSLIRDVRKSDLTHRSSPWPVYGNDALYVTHNTSATRHAAVYNVIHCITEYADNLINQRNYKYDII